MEPGATAFTVMLNGPSFLRHLPGQPEQAGLGAGVGLDTGDGRGQPGARRDVDDAAVPRLLHGGRHGLGAEEGAGEVGIEHGVPVCLRQLIDGAEALTAQAARVVHQHVHTPRRGQGGGYQGLHLGRIGDVTLGQMHRRRCSARRLRQALGQDVAAPDLGTGSGEGVHDSAAKAKRCTRHNDRTAREIATLVVPSQSDRRCTQAGTITTVSCTSYPE